MIGAPWFARTSSANCPSKLSVASSWRYITTCSTDAPRCRCHDAKAARAPDEDPVRHLERAHAAATTLGAGGATAFSRDGALHRDRHCIDRAILLGAGPAGADRCARAGALVVRPPRIRQQT